MSEPRNIPGCLRSNSKSSTKIKSSAESKENHGAKLSTFIDAVAKKTLDAGGTGNKAVRAKKTREEHKELQRQRHEERYHRRHQSIFMHKPRDMPHMKFELLRAVDTNDVVEAKKYIPQVMTVNFHDEYGMTPLLHVCYNGNLELVQILLKYNADYNVTREVDGYNCLHFAALSGNVELCRLFLDLGLDPLVPNGNNRTAAEVALISNNYSAGELLNYYVSVKHVELMLVEAKETGPVLDNTEAVNLQKMFCLVNLDPVRVAMNICDFGFLKKMPEVLNILKCMCLHEMTYKKHAINEVRAFRFFYMSWTISKMLGGWEKHIADPKFVELPEDLQMHNFLQMFLKSVIGEKEVDKRAYLENGFREFQEKYPYSSNFWFCQIQHDILSSRKYPVQTALRMATIGSYVGRIYTFCRTCDNYNPGEGCIKCNTLLYCDGRCMTQHSFIHAKTCNTPSFSCKPKRPQRKQRRNFSTDESQSPDKESAKPAPVRIPITFSVAVEAKKDVPRPLGLEDAKEWPALPPNRSNAKFFRSNDLEPDNKCESDNKDESDNKGESDNKCESECEEELSQTLSQWTINSLDC